MVGNWREMVGILPPTATSSSCKGEVSSPVRLQPFADVASNVPWVRFTASHGENASMQKNTCLRISNLALTKG